jgi:ankyrin repeat protein
MGTSCNWVNWTLGAAAIVACILLPVSSIAADPSVNEELFRAAENGYLEQIKGLLAKCREVNARDNDDQTLLMAAARWGNLEIVRLLIDKGAHVNARDGAGRTALMSAAERGNLEIVRLLIDKGAEVNAKTKGGATALMAAAWMGRFGVAKSLIGKGAGVNAKSETGQTALMYAVRSGNLEVVKLLVDRGADVNAANIGGETAMSLAFTTKDLSDIVQYLKDHGALFSVPSLSATAAEKKVEAAGEKARVSSSGKSQTSFCKKVSKMIKDKTIDKYIPEMVDLPIDVDPRGSEYLNLDIDGDGISDKVTVSSGSDESLLVVRLSSGGEYDLDEGLMCLVKLKGHIYALVAYYDTSVTNWKLVGHRLYELTRTKAELVCDTKDLERR